MTEHTQILPAYFQSAKRKSFYYVGAGIVDNNATIQNSNTHVSIRLVLSALWFVFLHIAFERFAYFSKAD